MLVDVKNIFNSFDPLNYWTIGKSAFFKLVQFTKALFRLMGLNAFSDRFKAFLRRQPTPPVVEGAGAPKAPPVIHEPIILRYKDEEIEKELKSLREKIREHCQESEVENRYFEGADFSQIRDWGSLSLYLNRLGCSPLSKGSIVEDDGLFIGCFIDVQFLNYSDAQLAHQMAKWEAVKAVRTCGGIKGGDLIFVSGVHAQFDETDLTKNLLEKPLSREIFSFNFDKSNPYPQTDTNTTHLYVMNRLYNGGVIVKRSCYTLRPGIDMNYVEPNAVDRRIPKCASTSLELTNWALSCLGFNSLIQVLNENLYPIYANGYLLPESLKEIQNLKKQFCEAGEKIEVPYLSSETLDLVFFPTPCIDDRLRNMWNNPKDRLLFWCYSQSDYEQLFLSSLKEANLFPWTEVLQMEDTTLYQIRVNYSEAKRYVVDWNKFIKDHLEANPKYMALIGAFSAGTNPAWKQRMIDEFPEPLADLRDKGFWNLQNLCRDSTQKEKLIQSIESNKWPENIRQKLYGFADFFMIGISQEEFEEFSREMGEYQFAAFYTGFVAQFNACKIALNKNPDKPIQVHIFDSEFKNFLNKEVVCKAFYKAGKEFEVWLQQNGCDQRVKVVFENTWETYRPHFFWQPK